MKKIIKKMLLGVGTIGTIVTPMATMVSCGSSDSGKVIKSYAYKNKIISEDFKWPEGVTTIDEEAFMGATLPKNFKIPSTVTKIGGAAFMGATFKGDFVVPSTVLNEGNPEYYGYTFSKAKFEGSLKYNLDSNMVADCEFSKADFSKSKGLILNDNISYIGMDAFMNAILPDNFKLPKGLTEIRDSAFSGASLPNDFVIPSSILMIKADAFYDAGSGGTKFRAGPREPLTDIIKQMIDIDFKSPSLYADEIKHIRYYAQDYYALFPKDYWNKVAPQNNQVV